ncbi:DUF3634 family protein [Shewanella intestini]|uniref:DUF3634 family protein n=1 Tax=Shewanella intestini TaxID=2017544 RepID=A0ABS5HYG3_9GAMM|nr:MULTISPECIES: DUF3634 family protein [Shewanella]MBR9726588.1 DUF3634 family protein [Shewanella intestini]MRG34846.1 DUF3634 family protein [Shewanella sp. XMDDZSB0408]
MDTALKIFFLVVACFLAYKLIFSKNKGLTLFEMHYKDGRLVKHKGKIPEKFQRESRVIAKKHKLTCAIRAQKQGDIRLNISANVSDELTQQLRNVFPFEYYERKQKDNSKLTG